MSAARSARPRAAGANPVRAAAPVALVALAACAGATRGASDTPAPAYAAARSNATAGAFRWPGTYDVVGIGFSEGSRAATMTVAARDTGYSLALVGPPGRLRSVRIAGDSAQVEWDLGGGTIMYLDVRGAGDSLAGRWGIDGESGALGGVRRPATPRP